MEDKLQRSATLFAKEMEGKTLGFEFSVFLFLFSPTERYLVLALNRDQNPMDNVKVYKKNDKLKDKLKNKLPKTDVQAKVKTKAPRRN